jgi:hypothetical protein
MGLFLILGILVLALAAGGALAVSMASRKRGPDD